MTNMLRTKPVITRTTLLALITLSSGFADAQQVTRSEIGAGLYAQSGTYAPGTPNPSKYYLYSPFLRYTLNLNSSLAVETSVATSVNGVPSYDLQGGHGTLVLGGLKAGVRRRHLGIFGRLDAGATSYSRGDEIFTLGSTLSPRFYRETHFTLQPGFAIEGYITPRTILRADVDENLTANFRTPTQQISGNFFGYSPGHVQRHLGLAFSVERRFGALEDAPALAPQPEHLSVGLFFPLQIREHLLESNIPALGGGGAWIELPNFRFLSSDIVAFDLPHDDHTAGSQDGGTSFSAFAGPKVGFHLGKLGIFAKARPGITRFSRTVSNVNSDTFTSVSHPQIHFTLDTGGVIEYTPSGHLLLRIEAGDALIFYHSHRVTYTASGMSGSGNALPIHNSSMLFLSGIGWRF